MKTLKKTKVDLLLDVLENGQWHSGDELAVKVSWRYGDAVHKARKRGHNIATKQVGLTYWYRWNRS